MAISLVPSSASFSISGKQFELAESLSRRGGRIQAIELVISVYESCATDAS